ncbi:MAG: YdcF family protein [Candidatus Acidiferrum sp.]
MLFTGLDSGKEIRHPLRERFPIFFGFLLVAISLTYFSLPLLGKWLVRVDPIHKADAIAVLTGRFPQRALEAAKLYRRGYAPAVWLTHPEKGGRLEAPGQSLRPSEDERNIKVLRSFGVPQQAIHVLDTPIVNTADELNAIDVGLKESGDTSVIVVTNKAHTRRVHSLWEKYHSRDGEILVHAVSYDRFAPSRWWKTPSTRAQGIHELLGMMNLWAGMPLHRPLQMNASGESGMVAPLL